MATVGLNRVIEHLRRTASAGLADGDLLERFVNSRDEGAFETLLQRHGPMVLGVCRRILRSEADAEDAFQATFLVLVRKANSIRPKGMVGNWLFGVAQNTALKAKAMIHKRRVKERESGTLPKPAAAEEVWQQVQALLDEELGRLPDKYRVTIVLCDLEGKTIKDAARRLDWPQGTVATRLAQGRRLLAKRLSKHGLALSGGVLAVLLSQGAVSAVVSVPLALFTTKAASGLISAKVATLTDGVVKAMFLTKLKIALTIAVVALLVMGGVSMFGGRTTIAAAAQTGGAVQASGEDESQFKPTGKPIGTSPSDPREMAPLYELQVQLIQDGMGSTAANKATKGPRIGEEENEFRLHRDVRDIRSLRMALPMAVPGRVQITPGGAVVGNAKREFLGVFLQATILEEKAKSVKIALTLEDIGLVGGKADIQRLFSTKQSGLLGVVQESSFDPKTMPGRLTIRVTVHRLKGPQPPRSANLPKQPGESSAANEPVYPNLDAHRQRGLDQEKLLRELDDAKLQSVKPSSYGGNPIDHDLWAVLGLKGKKAPESTVTKANRGLRGGVTVTDVRPQGAADSVILPGDILVGLDVWETLDVQACSFVLRQCQKQKSESVKYHVVRNAKLLTGTLNLRFPPVVEPSQGELPKAQTGKGTTVGRLLHERLAILKDRENVTEKAFQTGNATIVELAEAKTLVFQAEMALCESHQERLKVLEKAVAFARDYEGRAMQLHRKGLVSGTAVLALTAKRLEAEIALERARGR